MQICRAFHITPDAIMTQENTAAEIHEEEILSRLHTCTPKAKETALRLLETYLQSLD